MFLEVSRRSEASCFPPSPLEFFGRTKFNLSISKGKVFLLIIVFLLLKKFLVKKNKEPVIKSDALDAK